LLADDVGSWGQSGRLIQLEKTSLWPVSELISN
jgi:hypothetical protein